MPLTDFQRELLLLLKMHRNPNSYIAGGIAVHRTTDSLRYSNDIDFFHDTDEAVIDGVRQDCTLLGKKGYQINKLIEQPSFVRAVVARGEHVLKLEWVRDTAFRFFPVVEDPELGYRLHEVDLIVNKCLTLANRNAVRDIIDLIQLQQQVLSLTAACWAACGKDPGFTPRLLIDCMKRNSIIRPEELAAESLKNKLAASELKQMWYAILEETSSRIDAFPAADLGCIYVGVNNKVVRDPNPEKLSAMRRHFGSVGGTWPRVVEN